MPSAAVETAFRARLTALWTATPVVPADGVTDPPAGDGFLVVQYPVVNADKPVLGRRYFEDGAARLVLNVKREVGLAQGLAWADTLAALFRTQKFGGVETFAPSGASVDDANDDGNWLELSVIVPYRYQFNG